MRLFDSQIFAFPSVTVSGHQVFRNTSPRREARRQYRHLGLSPRKWLKPRKRGSAFARNCLKAPSPERLGGWLPSFLNITGARRGRLGGGTSNESE